jgi:multidrug efflux system outer membrane protein
MSRIARVPLAAAVALIALAGCVQGPDYHRPTFAAPQTFRAQVSPTEAASFADQPWWDVFGDPALQDLIHSALKNNYDLQVAVARIEQARALVDVAVSEGRPQIDYDVGVGAERTFVPGPRGTSAATTVTSVAGAIRASWELDLWGRIQRSTEAAQANLLAQEDARRGVMLSLVSDLATAYFRLLELDRELQIAQDAAKNYGKSYDFFNVRFKAGQDSRLPVVRAKANYDASNATIADLKRAIGVQEDAISILLGGFPQDVVRGRPLGEQSFPATPPGATTALLQRRPDIAQAEHVMMRANAEVGVAMANFFPRIGLSALLGGLSAGVGGGPWNEFAVWNLALSAGGPIWHGGQLQAIYNQRRAFWDETVADYKKTVISAFQETSDALHAQQNLGARREALEAQIDSLRSSSSLARNRFDEGRASYFEILEADERLFPAEAELARTQRDQLLAVVDLYRALGGGWQGSDQAPAPPAPHTPPA